MSLLLPLQLKRHFVRILGTLRKTQKVKDFLQNILFLLKLQTPLLEFFGFWYPTMLLLFHRL